MNEYFVGIDLAKPESLWRRILIRIFGRRFSNTDLSCTVVGYRYQGKIYIIDVRYD